MKNITKELACRVCNSNKNVINLINFLPKRFSQFFLFSYRGDNSSSIFCNKCGSLSFYNKKEINYKMENIETKVIKNYL